MPERSIQGSERSLPPPAPRPREPVPDPPSSRRELHCGRCAKPIRDLEMEPYFLQTGLCFWCAYVDSQG